MPSTSPNAASASRVSLSRFLIEAQREKGHINGDLRLLIEIVSRACKRISIAVGKGALGGTLGSAGTENVQGETQKKRDIVSNEILLEANEWGGHLAALGSGEMEDPHPIPHRYPKGEYLLRLMYEANPMAMIVEQAGGAATDGHQRILDIQPEKLHQRVPVFLGSKNEVERVTGYPRETTT